MINPTERSANIEYAIRDVLIPALKLEEQGRTILKLNIGDPIAFDFETPPHMVEAYCRALRDGHNGYSDSQGYKPLISSIVEHERKKYGTELDPSKVLVTAGISEALVFLFGALLEQGDEILVPGPSYPPYTTLVKFMGGVARTYRTDENNGWQPDIDDLRAKITDRTKAIAIINPNNPTGSAYTRQVLAPIIDLAAEHKLPIISDEIYDGLVYDLPHTSPLALSEEVPMVLLNGFSKVYMVPGWRVGYMAFRDTEGRLDGLYDGCIRQARVRLSTNHPAQVASLAALEGPQEHIEENRRKLMERRDIISRRINAIDGLSVARPEGAFYAFPRIDIERGPWKNDKAFVLDMLETAGVLCVHGSGFCEDFGKDHFRVVFLAPPAKLESACDAIEDFMATRLRD